MLASHTDFQEEMNEIERLVHSFGHVMFIVQKWENSKTGSGELFEFCTGYSGSARKTSCCSETTVRSASTYNSVRQRLYVIME